MRLLALLLLAALLAPQSISHAQEDQMYVYTGIAYILERTPQGPVLIGETPVTVSYWPEKRLVDINHGITHPLLATTLKRALTVPFTAASPEGEARIDVVYMASSTRSLYMCNEALAATIPGGTLYLEPSSLIPIAAEYSVEAQGLVIQVSLQLSVAPEPVCGVSITSTWKLAAIGGLALAIVVGAVYTFAVWRSRITGLWTLPY